MTQHDSTSGAPQGHPVAQAYPANQAYPGGQGYPGGPAYDPPVRVKPPLPRAVANRARLAGGIAFTLISWGWGLIAGVVLLALVAAAGSLILSSIVSGGSSSSTARDLERWTRTLPVGPIVAIAVVVFLIGVGLWVGGLFVSRGILRRAGHPRPWAVTWAALGISIVASWIVGFVIRIVSQLVSAGVQTSAFSGSPDVNSVLSVLGAYAVVIVVVGLIGLLSTIAIGVFAWWWMAHALRPASAVGGAASV